MQQLAARCGTQRESTENSARSPRRGSLREITAARLVVEAGRGEGVLSGGANLQNVAETIAQGVDVVMPMELAVHCDRLRAHALRAEDVFGCDEEGTKGGEGSREDSRTGALEPRQARAAWARACTADSPPLRYVLCESHRQRLSCTRGGSKADTGRACFSQLARRRATRLVADDAHGRE